MIESFHVAEENIAFWAGITSAIFSLSQCITAVPLGRLSDHWGRKPVVLLGLTCTMLTSLLWGFSTNLPMALVARVLQGGTNGNVGIIRTMVAEMCPWKELQPRAFSIMPLVWNLGSVLGPAFGGALSNPYKRKPSDTSNGPLLWKFPYALPNIVGSCFFLVGIVTGILFLDETLASKRHQRDHGRLIGIKLELTLKHRLKSLKDFLRRLRRSEETEPLLSSHHPSYFENATATNTTAVTAANSTKPSPSKAPTWRSVLTRQTLLNLLVYTLLAMHSVALDQLLPVFLHHPRSGPTVVPPSSEKPLQLHFNRGFGLHSAQIGLLFTLYGTVCIFYQFAVFPPVARHYGVLPCLRVVLWLMPLTYLAMPFSVLVPGQPTLLVALWLVKGLCTTFAFPCTTILLTNSASGVAVLATVNGIATSVSAVGRAAGPALAGSMFTWGAREGFVVAPFWMLGFVGVLGGVASFFLEEGEGFGDDGVEDIGEEGQGDVVGAEEEEWDGHIGAVERAKGAMLDEPDVEEAEDVMAPLLSREWTRGSLVSQAVSTESGYGDEEALAGEVPGFANRRASATWPRSLRRRSSVPIGMGVGFRRLSSNLGESRSGYGTGGGLAG
jgi:MFS family permease